VSRAMRTIDASRDPRIRMLRQPREKQMDYYYTQLLGKDWQKQFEQVRGAAAVEPWRRLCFGLGFALVFCLA